MIERWPIWLSGIVPLVVLVVEPVVLEGVVEVVTTPVVGSVVVVVVPLVVVCGRNEIACCNPAVPPDAIVAARLRE